MRCNDIRTAIVLTHQTAMRLAALGAIMARADVGCHLTSVRSPFSESAAHCAYTAIDRYVEAITAKGSARATLLAGATIRTQALVRLLDVCSAWSQQRLQEICQELKETLNGSAAESFSRAER